VAYAVGSDTCSGGLHMIDVANPVSPQFLACYASDGYTHDVQCTLKMIPYDMILLLPIHHHCFFVCSFSLITHKYTLCGLVPLYLVFGCHKAYSTRAAIQDILERRFALRTLMFQQWKPFSNDEDAFLYFRVEKKRVLYI
jgi:hypothetical protein